MTRIMESAHTPIASPSRARAQVVVGKRVYSIQRRRPSPSFAKAGKDVDGEMPGFSSFSFWGEQPAAASESATPEEAHHVVPWQSFKMHIGKKTLVSHVPKGLSWAKQPWFMMSGRLWWWCRVSDNSWAASIELQFTSSGCCILLPPNFQTGK